MARHSNRRDIFYGTEPPREFPIKKTPGAKPEPWPRDASPLENALDGFSFPSPTGTFGSRLRRRGGQRRGINARRAGVSSLTIPLSR